MALVITFLLTAGSIALAGADPLAAYAEFLIVPLTSRFSVLEVLVASTPILLTGAAVALAFRGGYWNIGAEGQLLVGAIMAAAVGQIAGLPQVVTVPLIDPGWCARRGVWALGPALLRVRFGIDEVVTTLLLNPVALLLVNALLHGPWRDPVSGFPESPRIAEAAEFPQLLERSRLHLGFLVALMVVAWSGTWSGGHRPAPAASRRPEPARRTVRRDRCRSDAAPDGPRSGAIAGIAGVGEVAGIEFRLTSGLSPGYGYTGIVVATLGGLTMPGVTWPPSCWGTYRSGRAPRAERSGSVAARGRRPGHAPARDDRPARGSGATVWSVRRSPRRGPASRLTRSRQTWRCHRSSSTRWMPRLPPSPGTTRPMTFFVDLIAATLRNATPLVYGGVGETFTERAGVLNLGIEGDDVRRGLHGFAVAYASGSLLLGLTAAIVVGLLAGGLMGAAHRDARGQPARLGHRPDDRVGRPVRVREPAHLRWHRTRADRSVPRARSPRRPRPARTDFSQYGLTWLAFLVVVPAAWWLLNRSSFGLDVRAVGENPEAADAAGVRVGLTRYLALMLGGALMAIGGAFITLALLGSFTLDIIAGRGWVAVAPRRLRSLAHHAGGRRCAPVRGGLFAPAPPSGSSRASERSPSSCCSLFRILWSSPRWRFGPQRRLPAGAILKPYRRS